MLLKYVFCIFDFKVFCVNFSANIMSDITETSETEAKTETVEEGVISMKQLLEAGVHFGHQSSQWNPAMKEYIYGSRNGIHRSDLQKT